MFLSLFFDRVGKSLSTNISTPRRGIMVKFFNHRESQRSNLEESIVRTQCFEKSQRAIQGHLLWKPVRFCDSEAHGGSSASPMNISP